MWGSGEITFIKMQVTKQCAPDFDLLHAGISRKKFIRIAIKMFMIFLMWGSGISRLIFVLTCIFVIFYILKKSTMNMHCFCSYCSTKPLITPWDYTSFTKTLWIFPLAESLSEQVTWLLWDPACSPTQCELRNFKWKIYAWLYLYSNIFQCLVYRKCLINVRFFLWKSETPGTSLLTQCILLCIVVICEILISATKL